MTTTIDARGLSCPEPALLARQAMLQAGTGLIIVQVDSVASRENVSRTATHAGWHVTIDDAVEGSFTLTLTK